MMEQLGMMDQSGYDRHSEHYSAVGAFRDAKPVDDGGNESTTLFVCTFPRLRTGKSD